MKKKKKIFNKMSAAAMSAAMAAAPLMPVASALAVDDDDDKIEERSVEDSDDTSDEVDKTENDTDNVEETTDTNDTDKSEDEKADDADKVEDTTNTDNADKSEDEKTDDTDKVEDNTDKSEDEKADNTDKTEKTADTEDTDKVEDNTDSDVADESEEEKEEEEDLEKELEDEELEEGLEEENLLKTSLKVNSLDDSLLKTNLLESKLLRSGSALGNLWPSGYGNDGDVYSTGNGTEEDPFVIDSVADLRTVAINIANDNHNDEDTYYLIEAGTYDLNGSWIPIGFAANDGGNVHAFNAHIAAEDGAHIKNMGFKANSSLGITDEIAKSIRNQESVGFFGTLGAGATVTNLYIDTGKNTIEGVDNVGILAGEATDATIKNCTVSGTVKGYGYVGGLIGYAHGSTTRLKDRGVLIEDTNADKVAVYSVTKPSSTSEFIDGHGAIGGVVGFASNTTIVDAEVSTNAGSGKHIYGNNAFVGGVVGVMENSDVYNVFVSSGEIGSSDSFAVGGLVGGYDGGQIKVGRFSANVVRPTSTNNYSACFIGASINNAGFDYGEAGDVAYLFADTKTKADTGIFGDRVEDSAIYDNDAHIGHWHSSDNYYTILSGANIENSEDMFYQELERGILNIQKTSSSDNVDTINHFTADKQGRPTRGYLLTINDPNVDGTTAAKITAYVNGSYKPVVTSEDQGAFAPGDTVYIQFEDLADGAGFFQMDNDQVDNPYYNYYEKDTFNGYAEDATQVGIRKGAGYYITMPESNVTVGAKYKKVSQAVTLNPNKVVFEIEQVRTGSREDPHVEWYATAYNGNKDTNSKAQVITDANGTKWDHIKLATIPSNAEKAAGQTESYYDEQFEIGSLVNGQTNNKFNLAWSTTNDGNSKIVSNPTVDNGNVNDKKAYVTLNVKDSSLATKVQELVNQQKEDGYKDDITTNAPIWFHSIVTATAQTEDSDDPTNPPTGYSDIDFKLNVKDNTNISVTGVSLNKNEVTYNVVRTLSGSRANPKVTYTVNGVNPESTNETVSDLNATFNPDYFSNDQVKWYLAAVGDNANFAEDQHTAVDYKTATQDDGTIVVATSGTGDKAYYNATVTLKGVTSTTVNNSTLSAFFDAQDQKYTSEMKQVPQDNSGSYTKYVKVTAADANTNVVTDTCKVVVNYSTVDNTVIEPTSVKIDGRVDTNGNVVNGANNIHDYQIFYTFKGDSTSEITDRNIRLVNAENTKVVNGVGEQLHATVSPEYDNTLPEFTPYNKNVVWSLANADANTNLNPYDVLNIDPATGQITVRGYSAETSVADDGYSPWIQSLIAEKKLDKQTVTIRVIAKSAYDNSIVDSHDIKVSFTGNTVAQDQTALTYDVVLSQEVATSLAGTDVKATNTWSGNDAKTITAQSTGTEEAPMFTVLNEDGSVNNSVVTVQTETSARKSIGTVAPNLDAQWISNIIANRANGNAGSQQVTIKAQTTNGSPLTEVPVTVNFRYDGVDMSASKAKILPENYTASPEVPTAETPNETYDLDKGTVKDRQITLDVIATQGNYSQDSAGTRKWSFGLVNLNNTTYTSEGVYTNDAVYEITGEAAKYCKVDANGNLVAIKGNWNDVISAGKTKGSVDGIITAVKEINGRRLTDSYKVTINFRYDKSVLDEHEQTFDVVYTQDSETNSPKSHWTGDDVIQLTAHISDGSGKDITPVWSSSDESIVTVDKDGRVSVNKDTWIKEIIDNAQNYDNNVRSGSKTVTVTAKHPTTGATADTCTFTVNFRYDQVLNDTHEEVYNIVETQTSRTLNPTVKWSGNDIRKANAKVFVAPGENNNAYWSSEDTSIAKVDDAGNIEAIIDADWMKNIVADNKYSGTKKVAINATNKEATIKDSTNVIVNYTYEDVEMEKNAQDLNITITATGRSSSPQYAITGDVTGAVSATLHSANSNEKTVVYSSANGSVLTVDANGKLALVIPTVEKTDAKGNKVTEQAQSTDFKNLASSLLKEAIKHPYYDRDGARYITSDTVVITAASEDGRMADQCSVKLNIKFVDNTYSSSGGGGGSSSGGGGGSSSSGVTTSGTVTKTIDNLPSYVIKGGQWTQNAEGKWFYTNGRTFTNEWAAVQNPYAKQGQDQFSWFHFNADSSMTTGWYTDENGLTYYLNPVSDGTQGRMFVGWNWIDDNGDGIYECYYFNPISDGTRGCLFKNTMTPDGYQVNEKGQWIQNGIVLTKTAAEVNAMVTQQSSNATPGTPNTLTPAVNSTNANTANGPSVPSGNSSNGPTVSSSNGPTGKA